jgi:hypothetical protein
MAPPYVCTGDNGSLYGQFHTDVAGSGQLVENSDIFDKLATEYNQHKFALRDALNAIKVTYTGQAADAMQGAFQPLIESVGQGFDLCRRSAVLLDSQKGGFDTAQAAIKKPVPVPEKPWLYSITPWDTGYDKAVQQNSQIDSANQQAFSQYAKTTLSNSNGVPKFESGDPGLGAITVGVLAALDDAAVHLRPVQPDKLAETIVGLLPPASAAKGQSVSVPVDVYRDVVAGISREDGLLRRNTPGGRLEGDVRSLQRLLSRPRLGGGRIYAGTRDRVGRRYKSDYPITYLDLDDGRWLVRQQPDDAGKPWVVAVPAGPATLVDTLWVLLRTVSRE